MAASRTNVYNTITDDNNGGTITNTIPTTFILHDTANQYISASVDTHPSKNKDTPLLVAGDSSSLRNQGSKYGGVN